MFLSYEMKFTIFLLLFLIVVEKSSEKTLRRKVPITANSSDVQNVNINCHDCRRVFKDVEGFTTPVNNASTYSHELVYGWTIEVPLNHEILLIFSWLNEEISPNETPTCDSCKPYFEIIYEIFSNEAVFKVDRFYKIRQLTNLTVPSHKTEIRFFSGVQCRESQKSENVGFAIYFKAIPLEPTWSLYTVLSVLIPTAFIILGVAYFCVIIKKKAENNQEVLSLPIQIYVDMDNTTSEFKKGLVKGKENRGRGLRLRTHHSSRLEEPKIITVISSLVEPEVSESSARPEDLVTPDSSNPPPVVVEEAKKQLIKKKLAPKVNLLNRYPRSGASTPKYASFYNEDRLSKSDIVLYEKGRDSRGNDTKIFSFDVLPPKGDPITQTELETSVFLHSSSASSADGMNESILELPFVSPKKH